MDSSIQKSERDKAALAMKTGEKEESEDEKEEYKNNDDHDDEIEEEGEEEEENNEEEEEEEENNEEEEEEEENNEEEEEEEEFENEDEEEDDDNSNDKKDKEENYEEEEEEEEEDDDDEEEDDDDDDDEEEEEEEEDDDDEEEDDDDDDEEEVDDEDDEGEEEVDPISSSDSASAISTPGSSPLQYNLTTENEAIKTDQMIETSPSGIEHTSQAHINFPEATCSSTEDPFSNQLPSLFSDNETSPIGMEIDYADDDSKKKSRKRPSSSSACTAPLREKYLQTTVESLTHELDKLEIHWPGDGRAKFDDEKKLKQFMEYQYPDWKNPGKVTSIPCVRIPRMIVRNDQLSEKLQKQYKSLQKGDKAENDIYRLFVNEVSTDDCGIMIFPNVDGSHIFEKGGPGSVEIDLIVAHPTKGIFVFNIKNEQKVNIQKLRTDIRKHTDFIRHIMCYGGRASGSSERIIEMKDLNDVPIHSVICYLPGHNSSIVKLADEINLYALQQKQLGRQPDQVIVFQKAELSNFAVRWAETIPKLRRMEKTDSFDTLVARLGALNSMEGSSSLLHQKFVSNDIQAIQVKKSKLEPMLADQIDGIFPEENAQWQQDLITTSKTLYNVSDKGKIPVILWTKEQLEIIGAVFKGLTDPSKENKPLRINVRGAKGTGKTMLMVHLAQLARCIYQNQQTEGQVIVCDGSTRAKLLFSYLEQAFQGSGIKLMKHVPKVSEHIKKSIIFVDEDPFTFRNGEAELSSWIGTEAHICIFSSKHQSIPKIGLQNNLTTFYLSYTMRSTKQLQMFTNKVISNSAPGYRDFSGLPCHSLDGTNRPDIIYEPSTNASEFSKKCVETVMKYVALSSSILVIIEFLSPQCQIEILSILEAKKVALLSTSYEINSDKERKKQLPIIQVESVEDIYGSEFQTVVIMLESKVFLGKDLFLGNFTMAVTRATTNLVIVAADTSFSNAVLEEKAISTLFRVL